MERVTNVDGKVIKSFGLTEEEHNAAVELITKNKRKVGVYTIEEDDGEEVNVWISQAFAEAYAEGEVDEELEEYARFLQSSLGGGATIYTLNDSLGGFSQPIGEVAVF